MAISSQTFRQLFGSFPSSVAIVTTTDEQGRPRGLTCNSISAVSTDPATLLVCIDKLSTTLPAITARGAFVVNLLAEGGRRAGQVFAERSADKFAALDWHPSRIEGGLPVLTQQALAYAECVVVQTLEVGDHWIMIGQVETAEVFERTPLLYWQRDYLPWRPAPSMVAVGEGILGELPQTD